LLAAIAAHLGEVPVTIVCWSVKGGSGTTVVATALSLVLARDSDALLVDLAGDVPATLGLPEPMGPGVTDWMFAGPDIGPSAIANLVLPAVAGVEVLPRGQVALVVDSTTAPRWEALGAALADDERHVVVDAGTTALPPPGLLDHATTLLVLRPCYLALRRAAAGPVRPDGVVLVREPGRALGAADVEAVLGVPVRCQVEVDPAVARAVDAGLLAGRLPAQLASAMRRAA
jgi:hypothetical protein